MDQQQQPQEPSRRQQLQLQQAEDRQEQVPCAEGTMSESISPPAASSLNSVSASSAAPRKTPEDGDEDASNSGGGRRSEGAPGNISEQHQVQQRHQPIRAVNPPPTEQQPSRVVSPDQHQKQGHQEQQVQQQQQHQHHHHHQQQQQKISQQQPSVNNRQHPTIARLPDATSSTPSKQQQQQHDASSQQLQQPRHGSAGRPPSLDTSVAGMGADNGSNNSGGGGGGGYPDVDPDEDEEEGDPDDEDDDEDVASKAAVALAAVAAAAVANNRSPAEAAREARAVAQTFISSAVNPQQQPISPPAAGGEHSSAAAAGVASAGGGGPGGGVAGGAMAPAGAAAVAGGDAIAVNHNEHAGGGKHRRGKSHRKLVTVSLTAVKGAFHQRVLSSSSSSSAAVLEKFFLEQCNDAFLQHLLLLEHFRCVDGDDEDDEDQQDGTANSPASSSSPAGADDGDDPGACQPTKKKKKPPNQAAVSAACDKLHGAIRKIDAAYEGLLSLLPPVAGSNSAGGRNSEAHRDGSEADSDCDPNDDDFDVETPVVIPDLLPPCITANGDATVEFFRACMGEATLALNAKAKKRHAERRNPASATPPDASLEGSGGGGGAAAAAQQQQQQQQQNPNHPPSPTRNSSGSTASSVIGSIFRRHSSSPEPNSAVASAASAATASSSSAASSGKGAVGALSGVFRKRRGSASSRADADASSSSGGGGSQRRSADPHSDPDASSGGLGHHHDAGSRNGEYVVLIEREMLGLTVENVLERTVVRTVLAGGPAKKAGAKVGSLIVKVGTVETKSLTHFETIDELRQSQRPLQLVLRQVSDSALRRAREEMGRLIRGSGFGTIMDHPHGAGANPGAGAGTAGNPEESASSNAASGGGGGGDPSQNSGADAAAGRPLIGNDLRIDAYTHQLKKRFAGAQQQMQQFNKKEEAVFRVGEKLVWILTLFVVGLEREATRLFRLAADRDGGSQRQQVRKHQHQRQHQHHRPSLYHHTAKDYADAAKSVSKVLLDYSRKKLDPQKRGATQQQQQQAKGGPQGRLGGRGPHNLPGPRGGRGAGARGRGPPPPPMVPGMPKNNQAAADSMIHEKPLLQIGDVLQRTRTFLADTTSPPAALLRGELIAFLCDVLDIDTDQELSEEETAMAGGGLPQSAGAINDLGSAGSLLKLIVLNCPIMRSPGCEALSEQQRREDQQDGELEAELKRRFGHGRDRFSSQDMHRLHAGNRFLAVVHRLAASRSVSARVAACSLGPVLWGHLDFPHQLQLRGVITRALHDVEVAVRKSTATVLHEIAELVFDPRSVPWLVLMCERAMTDPEPQLRSAAMTLTWHLAEHLPNAFLGDASQGSRYLARLPDRNDPIFADVYLLQCKLLPVATRLAEDRSPAVRLAVAAQCDRLCDALGDHWSSVIIDVLLALLSDQDERVRCEAVACVPRLAQIVLLSSIADAGGTTTTTPQTSGSEVSILEALIPASIKLRADKSSTVRVALASAAGELLTLLVALQRRMTTVGGPSDSQYPGVEPPPPPGSHYKKHVDERLIPLVQTLLNDADPEVTSAALRAVTNATRSSSHVVRNRQLSAASLAAAAAVEDDAASISSFSTHCSQQQQQEPVFLPVLSEVQVLRLLPTLSELAESRQWRVRQSAVEIVPALLGCTTKLETRSQISKLCIRLMSDTVDAVRKTAAECLCLGGSSLGSHGSEAAAEWITSIVIPAIRSFAVHSNSKQRLLSLKMVETVLLNGACPGSWSDTQATATGATDTTTTKPPQPGENHHDEGVGAVDERMTDSPVRELAVIALSLTTDRIANVRLNVGRVLESVLQVFEEEDLQFILTVLQQQIESEREREGGGDRDVLFFANRCCQTARQLLLALEDAAGALGGGSSHQHRGSNANA